MQYTIRHDGRLKGLENINFQIDLVKLNKSAKNKSYPNLSNCCGVVLNQSKFCSSCKTEIKGETSTKKQFKLGKETYAIPTANLEAIKKALDTDTITIIQYVDESDVDTKYFTEGIFSSKVFKKSGKEYAEFAEVLDMSGKVAIGEMVYNSRPYPVMIFHEDGHICFRLLHFADELDTHPEIEAASANAQKVELLTKIVDMNSKKSKFNIKAFVNAREEKEEELIMAVLENKPIVAAYEVETARESVSDKSEIERLKALLGEEA